MAYGKDDELAINTIRLLAVSLSPLWPQSYGSDPPKSRLFLFDVPNPYTHELALINCFS